MRFCVGVGRSVTQMLDHGLGLEVVLGAGAATAIVRGGAVAGAAEAAWVTTGAGWGATCMVKGWVA